MLPPFLMFFDLSQIDRDTSFSWRLVDVVHSLCSDQLYGCTCKLFSSLCTFVQKNLAPAWPQYDVSTCWNLIGQKEASRTAKVAYIGGVPPPKNRLTGKKSSYFLPKKYAILDTFFETFSLIFQHFLNERSMIEPKRQVRLDMVEK